MLYQLSHVRTATLTGAHISLAHGALARARPKATGHEPASPVSGGCTGGRLSAMRTVIVNGDALTVEDVVEVALGRARAELAAEVPARMKASLDIVTSAIAGPTPVYGVNTGFGALADTSVGAQDLATLQRSIVM